MLWIKEVEMVDSVEYFKTSRSIQGYTHFPNLRCSMRGLRLLWTRSSRIPSSRKGQSGGTESPERGQVSTRKTDRLHDLQPISNHWCSWYRPWLCSFVLYHSSHVHVQEFDTRWDEFPLSMTKILTDDVLECLYKSRTRQSDQLKNVSKILQHKSSSEDIDARLSNIEDDGEEKHRSETQITKRWRQNWDN